MSTPSEFHPSEFISSADGSQPTSDFTETQLMPNQGGMSIVQKAKILGKWHLIKRLKPEYSNHPIYITNFEKEFEIAYHLDHPHIVRYLNKGHDKDGLYIIMEYVDGQSLRTILNQNGVIKSNKLIEKIFLQLLDALSYLHKRQVYHLDLKPENIMLTNKGANIKLLDFGLSGTDSHLPIDSGTLKYASPEQTSNAEIVDGRSDIYALGILLLELIQGDTDKKNTIQLKGVFKKVITKCVMEIPAARFQSAEEIIEFIYKNKKRNNIIRYSVIIALIFFAVLPYLVMRFDKEQLVNNEKMSSATLIDHKKLIELIPDAKEASKKLKPILSTYYDSLISTNDSIRCIQLGESLYNNFIEKVKIYDKAPSHRSRKLVLQSIQDTCIQENQKQWSGFSSAFSLGSMKYSKAERIYSNAQKESAAKIWEILFPNSKQ